MNDQTEQTPQWQEVFALNAQKEAEAYTLFEQRFDRDFPTPEKVNVRLMQTIGWQFIVIIIQNIAAVLLAALRTADMFYTAASGSWPWLQFVEAAMAIMAIEFGAVVFAAIKAEIENRSEDEDVLRKSALASTRQLWIGIGAAVLLSIVAGLGTSFRGFDIDIGFFNWVLAIGMGIGASVIAAISGDILGVMLARLGNIRDGAQREYEGKMDERIEKKRQMWENAPERQIARSELTELKNLLRSQQGGHPTPRPQRTSTRNRDIRVKIYNELDVDWAKHQDPGQLLGPSALQAILGVSKGYASEARRDWAAERGIELP